MGRRPRRPTVIRNDFPIFFRSPQRTIHPYGPDTRPARQSNFRTAPQKGCGSAAYLNFRAAKRGGPYNLRDSFPKIRWAAVGGGPYGAVG